MSITTILIDIDGCMLSTQGDVSPVYYRGLHKVSQYIELANKGTFSSIGFCTGRDRNYVEAVAFMAGLPNWWSVIESGIALFNPTTKKLLFNPVLTWETRKAFEEISQRQIPEILEKYPELFLYPGNMINVAIEIIPGSDIEIAEAYQEIKNELGPMLEQEVITIHHSDSAVDISPAGISKASGVQFLSELAEVPVEHMLGIGDTNGDFPMLELVRYVGCPSNASEDCKKLVQSRGFYGYASPYASAAGVADIIKYFADAG